MQNLVPNLISLLPLVEHTLPQAICAKVTKYLALQVSQKINGKLSPA